ncbi:MAG: cytochrome c [Verrucomicrobiota bacterium]
MNRVLLSFIAVAMGLCSFLPLHVSANDDPALAAAMRFGRMKAMSCAGCHGMDGKGIERDGAWIAPSYESSEILKNDPEKLALIILKGIKKESEHYSGQMNGFEAVLDDRSLAAVMTYVRNQWGGHSDVVTADQAKAWREKYADRTEAISPAELAE